MSWSSGICGCFEDVGICAMAYFCPCVIAGKNAEAVGESCPAHGFFSLLGCVGMYCGAQIRGKIREKYGIEVSKIDYLWCAFVLMILRAFCIILLWRSLANFYAFCFRGVLAMTACSIGFYHCVRMHKRQG